ncbi:MAG: hypothetical protein KGZ85_04775 [Ignavibacterium sp.]|nr:hypothetical protein [Ignavibacterium sp.]
MIKNIILFLFLFGLMVNAQDETRQTPSIELPDFVITGRDVISVKKVNKISPDFVSTISDEFLRPAFSPDELELRDLSNPIKSDLNLLDSISFYRGNVEAGAGLYTIPTVKASYAYPFTNGIIQGVFSGIYNRAYDIEFSDRYSVNLGGHFVYWSDIHNNFLPGTQSNISADIGTTSFKLFASPNPQTKRTINYGNLLIGLRNNFNKNFQFGFTLADHVTTLSDEGFNDNYFRLKVESKVLVSILDLGITADYHKHYIKNSAGSKQGSDIFLFRPAAGFKISDIFRAALGFTFSNSGGKNFNAPYALMGIKLHNNFTIFGEYSPIAELISSGTFLRQNEYFNSVKYSSTYFKKSDYFDVAIKFEYGPYYQINGGVKYFSSNEYPYFISSSEQGKFELETIKMNSINPYLNLLYHLGPYGKFYGTINVAFVKTSIDTLNTFVPYHPVINAIGTYSYRFAVGLESSIKLSYYSKTYADLSNEIQIDPFIDLGLEFIYILIPDLDLTLRLNNLLNNKNYTWFGYKEMPLNVIFGINYRF